MTAKSGFTLPEIVVTLILLSFGILALSQALSTGILTSTDIENVDLALNIAQAKLEEIRNTSFASISSGGPSADLNFSNFNVTVAVSGTDPKQVDVTVDWNVKGGSESLASTTLVANCSCY